MRPLPRPLPLTLSILALLVAPAATGADDGLTAYRGAHWIHLQASAAQPTLWLGRDRSVELPAVDSAPTTYHDLILLGREADGVMRWLVAGVARTSAGDRFLLRAGQDRNVLALELPGRPGSSAARIASTRWLASPDSASPQGLAWLEANRPRAEELWLAPYRDGQFEPARRLVGAGPGSQTGLDTAILADGSWLLVWCAFDGTDDDLVWRQRQPSGDWVGGRVSPDNQVPDITPRLLVTDDGAAVAWSRYDGNAYRVRTARFDRGSWSSEDWAAPPDSLYPAWLGDGRTLLFFEGARRSWSARGPASIVRFETTAGVAPVVDRDPASGLLRSFWLDAAGWRSAPGERLGGAP